MSFHGQSQVCLHVSTTSFGSYGTKVSHIQLQFGSYVARVSPAYNVLAFIDHDNWVSSTFNYHIAIVDWVQRPSAICHMGNHKCVGSYGTKVSPDVVFSWWRRNTSLKKEKKWAKKGSKVVCPKKERMARRLTPSDVSCGTRTRAILIENSDAGSRDFT